MDTGKDKGASSNGSPCQEVLEAPESRSIPIATRGLRSSRDVKAFCFAVAEDAIRGAVNPTAAGKAISGVSAGLRMMQLELRYKENLQPAGDGGLNLLEGPRDTVQEDAEIAALEKLLAAKKAARG